MKEIILDKEHSMLEHQPIDDEEIKEMSMMPIDNQRIKALEEELRELRESEMWQTGKAVRALRPENAKVKV